jgi:hypothetical protein
MSPTGRTIAVCIVALFIAAQTILIAAPRLGAHGIAPEIESKSGKPPVYTVADAEQCIKEVLPVVEELNGRKLRMVPPCRISKKTSQGGWLSGDTLATCLALMPQLTSKDWAMIQYIMSQGGAGGAVASYDYLDHVIWLTPNAFDQMFESGRLRRANARAYLKVILAHELTHAVQDQEIDFIRSRNMAGTNDTQWAYTSTVEGMAEYMEQKAAVTMNMQQAEQELLDSGKRGKDDVGHWKVAPVILFDALSASQDHIYFSGRDFISWQFDHGGIEQVWKVLANPPTSTSVIFHPDRYPEPHKTPVQYEQALFWLAQQLGDTWEVDRNMSVGEMILRSAFVSMGEEARKKAVNSLDHVQVLIASNNQSSMATITMFVLKDRSMTNDFVDLMKKLEQGNFAKMNTRRILIAGSKSLQGIDGCCYSSKICYTYKGGKGSVDYLCTRIARDRVVLEIDVQDQYPDDKVLITIANKVFSRLEQMGILPVEKPGVKPTTTAAK